jgi:putative acetyltransferase
MTNRANIVIASPAGSEDTAAVKALFAEYAESLGFSLQYQDFDAELAGLPGPYVPPGGALRLALVDGAPAGAVGLRPLELDICEMKRLYVRPAYRGLRTAEGISIGRALALAIVEEARTLGYARMRLDTVAGIMDAAIGLYRSMGFVAIPPYYASPVPSTVFMELVLAPRPH